MCVCVGGLCVLFASCVLLLASKINVHSDG
jgi:hypothetical protein